MLKAWTLYEKIWLFTAVGIITAVTIVTTWIAVDGDLSKLQLTDGIGFISSIAGILCVIFAAKGRIATFYVGIIQAGTYAYISYQYHLYGEAMLNAFFFLPAQFVGLWLWNRNKKNKNDAEHGEQVYAKRLTIKQWAWLIPVIAVTATVYAIILTNIGAQQVRIDSIAVVLSVFAQILMTLRYAEQWLMWIVINVLTITLWVLTLTKAPATNDWAILVMWCAFLVNSIYGYLNWRKISKPEPHAEIQDATTA